MGTVVAPLLAGFSITLLGIVVQYDKALRWPDLALLLLATASVLLLSVVQFTYRAHRYATIPNEAKSWYPEIERDRAQRDRVYEELRNHRACHQFWAGRARRLYNVAICVLLLGISVVLVPSSPMGPLRVAAAGVVLLGLAGELLLLTAGWLLAPGRRGRRGRRGRVARAAWWLASGDPLTRP
jgi:hypothetical protein